LEFLVRQAMKKISLEKLKNNLNTVLDEVSDSNELFVISKDDGNLMIIPEAEYNSLVKVRQKESEEREARWERMEAMCDHNKREQSDEAWKSAEAICDENERRLGIGKYANSPEAVREREKRERKREQDAAWINKFLRSVQALKVQIKLLNSVEIYSEDRIKEFSKMNNEELEDFNLNHIYLEN